MRALLFLSRLALICNGLFLACLVIQRIPHFEGIPAANNVVITLGWVLAPFINLCATLGYLISRILKKEGNFPPWLAVVNLLFLVVQLFTHFILA